MSSQYADLRETLAALEHERWSLWQSYVFSRCDRREDGGATIPADLVERWQRQSETPYDQLSEREKQSDREQVDRYWPLIEAYVASQTTIGHGGPPAEHACPHPPDVRPGPVPVRPDLECGQTPKPATRNAHPEADTSPSGTYEIQESPEGAVFYSERGIPLPGDEAPPTR